MKKSIRRRLPVALAASFAVIGLAVVPASPAAAESATLQETTGYGYVVNWDTPRTNMKNPSASSFTMNSQTPGTGAPFVLGLRNAGGQFARAQAYPGQTAGLALSNGSTELPRGTFYLNTKVEGACGGTGSGAITWNITFRWNL